ncbi:MAG TPA: serine/threonine-protein kinase [Gemmatimonadaceae bacterium]|nr:serine/threonine-protein kinase [Gemmatimonadaceae bacterium]
MSGDPAATTIAAENGDAHLLAVRRAVAAEYEVERELGRGGMAIVYKAREVELDRPVALKVLPPELAPVGGVSERFKREARLAASLDHPNVIPVYRVGQAGGVLYMAMKFIDGQPLDALIQSQRALPLPVVLLVLRSAAHALAFAHEHGIVHRDIKGANILVDRDGRVVVSDFGIARAVESSSLTATGAMVGTPHFMSPEQCAGKPVGPQSDQYSLGIVAYQMLTGTVPFDGDSIPEILQQHWWTQAPDASQARPDCPAALTAAVQRMLAKAPEGRFATTAELAATLDAMHLPDDTAGTGERQLRAMVRALSPGEPVVRRPRTTPGVKTTTGAPAPTPAAPTPTAPPETTRRLDTPAVSTAASRSPRPVIARPRRKRPGRWRYVAAIVALVTILGTAGGAVAQRRSIAAVPTPRTATDMLRIGHHAYRRGDYELARRFFVRALTLDPANPTTQADLGCALQKLGRRADALPHFRAAGESAPGECAVLAADAVADTNWLPGPTR